MYQIIQNQKESAQVKKDTLQKILETIKQIEDKDKENLIILTDACVPLALEIDYEKKNLCGIKILCPVFLHRKSCFLQGKYDHYLIVLPKKLFKEFIIDSDDNKIPLIKIEDFVNKDYEKIIDISFKYKIALDFDEYQSKIQTFVLEQSKCILRILSKKPSSI